MAEIDPERQAAEMLLVMRTLNLSQLCHVAALDSQLCGVIHLML